ncbi:thiamine pyrophosphate-dependent dehydrogenase E1 component subunit alpha [Vibrio penaeicida]|uniref:Pyruvate dehydrogenase E1 component subunit alpha n=1 Tax=Vibrio penaeicida TaxID=104609 RepID=A0AAV5NKZ6_9VIBR|nr:thiamine pyrophosphate-dependent dehydrogenase E1 component subunit alpha [Vibrio penaeicida]RTZ19821.1 thiamine pyrophosphate-dependent dehydrogenase E1 component subunit alpha [Vibrio penaeicida]GLQ70887.1 pyruvate dehydrogenase E1 component subunit alpha [Vibrio penaeicida]
MPLEITEEIQWSLYKTMLRARGFEQRASDLFLQNLVKGTNHLAMGQEAVAAGFGVAMKKGDYTFCTYRGHTHTLVRGADMSALFAELMGREGGILSGKGGSMHLTSVEHGAMGSYAIIGAQLCIATGSAWKSQYKESGEVTVVFFGDGTTNIGAFHEALNFAVIWSLPVVFVCENNLYMEYTPIGNVTAVEHPAADRASAYGLESIIVDGNDADAMFEVAQSAIEKARQGGGPSLIEAKTYRHQGHSRADPGKYRPKEELEKWLAYDPIDIYRDRLLQQGVDKNRIEQLEAEVENEIDEATEKAKTSPAPSEALCFKDVWANGGWEWRS